MKKIKKYLKSNEISFVRVTHLNILILFSTFERRLESIITVQFDWVFTENFYSWDNIFRSNEIEFEKCVIISKKMEMQKLFFLPFIRTISKIYVNFNLIILRIFNVHSNICHMVERRHYNARMDNFLSVNLLGQKLCKHWRTFLVIVFSDHMHFYV